MKKSTILGFNLAWGVLLLLIFSWNAYALGPFFFEKLFFLIAVLLVTSGVFALRGKRWAAIVSAILAGFLFVFLTPLVAINFYMYFTGRGIYKNSPDTIIMVWTCLFLFVMPSAFMLWHYDTKRNLFFKSSQKSEQAEQRLCED